MIIAYKQQALRNNILSFNMDINLSLNLIYLQSDQIIQEAWNSFHACTLIWFMMIINLLLQQFDIQGQAMFLCWQIDWMQQYQMQFKYRKSKHYCRYNKISQQKKFHLLTLVLREKMLIKQAAKVIGINYSTAKTIIFFHRNHGKSYQFDFQHDLPTQQLPQRIVATFKEIPYQSDDADCGLSYIPMPIQMIDVVSTIGSKKSMIDFNSLQTRLAQDQQHLSNSHSPKLNGITKDPPDERNGRDKQRNCQCERRITRAQSAKGAQAGQEHLQISVLRQEQLIDPQSQSSPCQL